MPLGTSFASVLRKGRNADAIAIFKLNVEEYPKSGNVYDSLAEAFAKGRSKKQAIANYRKSLELDPKNQNAANKLKELEQNASAPWSVLP